MNVLVDTSIWSLSLRRAISVSKEEKALITELKELIRDARAAIIGPIRQEVLSGITDPDQHSRLKEKLSAFEDISLQKDDYEQAAEFYNICRKNGVQGSHTDFLICAVAYRRKLPIFTTDRDLEMYGKHLQIELYASKKPM